jgi:hypothetical protein
MLVDQHNAWWAATPTFSSVSFVCSLEIKTRNDGTDHRTTIEKRHGHKPAPAGNHKLSDVDTAKHLPQSSLTGGT